MLVTGSIAGHTVYVHMFSLIKATLYLWCVCVWGGGGGVLVDMWAGGGGWGGVIINSVLIHP